MIFRFILSLEKGTVNTVGVYIRKHYCMEIQEQNPYSIKLQPGIVHNRLSCNLSLRCGTIDPCALSANGPPIPIATIKPQETPLYFWSISLTRA